MKASELHRKLLYKGHDELSAFLEESPLNYHLYQFLRDVKPRHQVNMSMVYILNEVYFICIRASRDLTPGNRIDERYVADEKAWTGSSQATDLIFCVVYIVLSIQKELSYALKCFLGEVFAQIQVCKFIQETNEFLAKLKEENRYVESDFTPQPVAVSELPSYVDKQPPSYIDEIMQNYSRSTNPWCVVTNGYAQTYILNFLRCYHSKHEQRVLLEHIQESAGVVERIEMEGFYTETFEMIKMGEFLPRTVVKSVTMTSPEKSQKELAIAYQQIEYLKQQLIDAEQAYNAKLAEQRADFERRLSRMEAQYQVDLAANKEIAEIQQKTAAMPSEPYFTLKELVIHASSNCTRQNADTVTAMFYRLSSLHGYNSQETISLIDSIIPAIEQRNPLHQTIDLPNVSQFNNNPQTVNNYKQPE